MRRLRWPDWSESIRIDAALCFLVGLVLFHPVDLSVAQEWVSGPVLDGSQLPFVCESGDGHRAENDALPSLINVAIGDRSPDADYFLPIPQIGKVFLRNGEFVIGPQFMDGVRPKIDSFDLIGGE